MTKRSTTALTPEQHAAQDARYAQNHEYDYIIVGSGSSALTVGSLLANAGHKICILEAHDIPGGYAQNFKRGDYTFNAQVHYIWGCAPGGKIYEFLKKLGLEKEVTFEHYDPEGYDHMVMPDGKRVKVPYGWDKLVENIVEAYPDQKEPAEKFVSIIKNIRKELHRLPDGASKWWEYYKALGCRTVLRYYKKTLQEVFDECGLSVEAQSVLAANMGDFMSPPEKLSFIIYLSLFAGYNTGAYYPTKHFSHYINKITESITSKDGCHIYYETPVTGVEMAEGKVTAVTTANGKTFRAPQFIWNGDPQMAGEMIGWEHFPAKQKKKMEYEYCPAGIMLYLGLKDINLEEHGFGKHNTWHLEDWDMNENYKKQAAGDFSKPWVFISTPTLHSKEPGTAPEGIEIMEIATHTAYEPFKEAQERDTKEYARMKKELAEKIIDLIEKRYIPNIREHIAMKVVGTSTTNEDYVMVPKGSAYGAAMTPAQTALGRMNHESPWKNFYWCNATAGYPGVYGTVSTGMKLYMHLTGDQFYRGSDAPTDEEAIQQLIELDRQ